MDGEQISETFKKYRETGEVALRNRLAEHYLYIAEILAKKFVNRGVEYDDLYQVASLALLKGIERFDPDMGMQFTTFITPTITGEIKNYFRDKSRAVKLPRKLAALRGEIRKKRDEIQAETGKKPTAAEIAKAIGAEEEDVLRAMEMSGVLSLDTMAGNEDDEHSLYDVIPDDSNPFSSFEDKESLEKAMADFTETEKKLLRLRYGEELSQTATAKQLGVSQMFVSRMERKLLQRLKNTLTAEN